METRQFGRALTLLAAAFYNEAVGKKRGTPVEAALAIDVNPSKKWLWALLALTAITFSRCLQMGYVQWDDNVMLVENMILKLPFLEALRHSFAGFFHGDYIPLTLMSFWFDLKLLGLTATQQHIENLLLHLLNVVLLWNLLPRFSFSRAGSIFVSVVFALHPAQAESVLWVSERKGLLATGLLFAAAWASQSANAREGRARYARIALYAGLYALAFLAKSNGVLLPAVLGVADRWVNGLRWKDVWLKHGPVLVIGALASWLRIVAYRSSMPELMQITASAERFLQLPLSMTAAIGFYARLLVWPFNLSIIYPQYADGSEWRGTLILGVATLALVAWAWRKSDAKKWWAFFVAWAFCFLLPVLQIIARINFVNDRYIYAPIVGLAGLLWLALSRLRRPERLAFWAALPMAAVSYARSEVWIDNLRLWSDAVVKAPWSGLAHNNLAQAHLERNDLDGAVAELQKTLQYGAIDGTDNLAYNNLALIFSSPEYGKYYNPRLAIQLLQQGIARSPRFEDAFILRYNLANTLTLLKAYPQALRVIRELERDLEHSSNQRYYYLLAQARGLRATVEKVAPHSHAETR